MKIHHLFGAFILLSSTLAFSHGDTDWRKDKKAFQSAKLEPLPLVNKSSQEQFESYEVDVEFFKEKLAQFSGAKDIILNGKPTRISERSSRQNKNLARKFLKSEYEKIGFVVSSHDYGNGINFIAEKQGTSSKVLILSAHMDSVGNAGANDDGIGVIGSLAVAKALEAVNFNHTLRILAFDQEERGLIGSKKYVKSISQEKSNIIADIQIEMFGTNARNDGNFHIIDCDKSNSKQFTADLTNAIVALGLPLRRVSACTEASDHAAFWRAGIPAIVISENFFGGDSDQCYHRSCDVYDDRLNFEYAANIVKVIASATSKILQPL